MAAELTKIIVVAQAETGDVLQEGVVVDEHAAAEGEHTATEVAHEGPKVFPPFDATTFASQLLWLAITFGVLYVIISRMAIPRIGGILESRRVRIEGDLKEAERLRLETERAAAAYEQALAEARGNAHAIAEETRASIRADIDGKRLKVEQDLSRKVAEAESRIQATKAEALGKVDEIAADTVAALVGQLTGSVSAKDARDAVAAVVKE